MSLPVILTGAGGHAKVLVDALRVAGREIKGILLPDKSLWGTSIWGIPVVGDDDCIDRYRIDEIEIVNGIGSIRDPSTRKNVFTKMKNKGFCFATVVHPSAVVSVESSSREGTQIMAGAIIQAGCEIGRNVIINTGAIVDHDCHIGDHVHLAPGVSISGGVMVGAGTHIGTGASVIQGITIGESVVVAAGSVVTQDIADGVQVRGIPARILKEGAIW